MIQPGMVLVRFLKDGAGRAKGHEEVQDASLAATWASAGLVEVVKSSSKRGSPVDRSAEKLTHEG